MWRRGLAGAALALLLALVPALVPGPAVADPLWLMLPPTPTLPQPEQSGLAPVNDISMYYAVFGDGPPVILLHGGLTNSNYWGNQVPALARHYRVIVADSRGHGRSTRSAKPYSYELMASDVVGLMDDLKIPKAAIVGWSDGAIIGLELAIHHPDRLTGVFAFAANYTPEGVKSDLGTNPTFAKMTDRARLEYEGLSPTAKDYIGFRAAIEHMWATEPHISKAELSAIKVPVVIADGDHDEAIVRAQTEEMAALIPGAGLLIQPNVSHFSMLQDPGQFNDDVLHFLKQLGP
jgi:pimeloyl-ACP methyl ester carboxylesterase